MNVKDRMLFARADALELRDLAQQRVERLLLPQADEPRDCVGGQSRINAQAPQNSGGRRVQIGEERGEKVVRFDLLTSLLPYASQRPIEQIASRFWDAHLAPHVNGAFGKFLFQQACG